MLRNIILMFYRVNQGRTANLWVFWQTFLDSVWIFSKILFITSSFSFDVTIQGPEGPRGFQGPPGTTGPKGQKVVCKIWIFKIIDYY